MRIIAGKWKGRRLQAPAGSKVRPTADRVREAWMSILQGDLPAARVLDLFAGSGALGLEALSRGAQSADFVEMHAASLATLRKNIELLQADDVTVHRVDALKFIRQLDGESYDIAFADPPYRMGLAADVATRWLASPFSRVLSVEHESREAMPPGGDTRRYGDSAITFYRSGPSSGSGN